jgi:DHA3 family multidrug efflux protein-like MFS transporter
VVGTFGWLLLIPAIEAAEQTVLQRAIPFERQGRVFGFAQLVENAASPLTALMIGPAAEVFFMPFDRGRGADWIGGGSAPGRAHRPCSPWPVSSASPSPARASRSP